MHGDHQSHKTNAMTPSSNKEKLVKGVTFLSIAFPFLFAGPAFYYWVGAPALRVGNWGWAAFIVIMMFVSVGLVVRGIALVLDGFFDHH